MSRTTLFFQKKNSKNENWVICVRPQIKTKKKENRQRIIHIRYTSQTKNIFTHIFIYLFVFISITFSVCMSKKNTLIFLVYLVTGIGCWESSNGSITYYPKIPFEASAFFLGFVISGINIQELCPMPNCFCLWALFVM